MAETRDLLLRFLGDSRSLDKSSKSARGDLGKVEKQSKRSSSAIRGINKAFVGLGLAIGAAEIARWANDAADMADSAEQAAGSIEKVLGPATQSFRDNLDDTRRMLGLNTLEIDQLGSKFGLLITGMGVSSESAAEYSEKLIDVGGDLAAFRGELSEAPAAVDAMAAALRSEFDPLEQFGVKLSEAKIQAEILRLEGLDPLFAALPEGEKRFQAIFGLIEREAAPAMGALEDATDSTAAAQNELNTELEDMQIEMGGAINDIKGPLLGALLAAFRGFKGFFEGLGVIIANFLIDNWDTIQQIRQGWSSTVAFMGNVARGFFALFAAIGRAIGSVRSGIAGLASAASSVASTIGRLRIPGFATGGMVPGPAGSPQLAVVHGGERVLTPQQQRSRGGGGGDGGGGPVFNITVNAGIGNPQETARALVDVLQVYNRTNGRIPIDVAGAGF